ncbi:acyltransferase [Methylobacterium sp. 37f]|uniref:acyltransferase family protein n=1 Tax=Methylobacterium sp. 37f TaxID=2817058 RepID=UPI001FFC62C6|nr:acyltransferase [Methylobacterium sp. 37f]MCK2054601.1 acyltransferase [Methylobacterium sp. 37f]
MPSQQEIRALTGIRGAAAILVVVYHYLALGAGSGLGGAFIKHGYLAVDLFFVLSGFVMALSHGRDFPSGYALAPFRRFLTKRFARIYPLYIVTSFACLALWLVDGSVHDRIPAPSLLTIVSNVVLVQSWAIGTSLNGPGWSISTEFFAYLMFPALAFGLLHGPRRAIPPFLALAAALLWILGRLPNQAVHQDFRFGPLDLYIGETAYPLLRCLVGFSLGLVAWRLTSLPVCRRVMAWRGTGDTLVLCVLLLMAVPSSDLILILLFPALIMALATGTSLSAHILALAPIHRLGVLSYSIYLVHFPILTHLEPRLAALFEGAQVAHPHLMSAAILIPVTVLLSLATFRLVEKPGRRLFRAAPADGSDAAPVVASGARP